MQPVSEGWKNIHKDLLLPESFVEVSVNVGDPNSQADATISDNGQEDYSNTEKIIRRTNTSPTKYTTLEPNLWELDGTFEILPDAPPYGENGYISGEISDDYGYYAITPMLTIGFSKIFDVLIPGITIEWAPEYEEYATSFRITAYNGENVVAQSEIANNTDMISEVFMEVQGYNKIVVEILKWCLPNRRARIKRLTVGLLKKYTRTEIMNYTHIMYADPLSTVLPKSEITFEIANLNGEYNPDNPSGVEKYFLERQMVEARYGYKLNDSIEWIDGGTFFLSEWITPQNGITATFSARDILEYLTDKYTGTSSGNLYEIATAALEQVNLPLLDDGTVRWRIDASLGNIVAADADLSAYTIAEVLQLCAHAACCVFYQDRQGVLRIEPLKDGVTDYSINRFNSFANSEIELTKQLKAVQINGDLLTLPVSDTGEVQEVNNPLISLTRRGAVAQWTADYLVNRRILTGDFRSDPRLDVLDRITNVNQFAESIVLVTEITYRYNGAFKGSYEGRAGV